MAVPVQVAAHVVAVAHQAALRSAQPAPAIPRKIKAKTFFPTLDRELMMHLHQESVLSCLRPVLFLVLRSSITYWTSSFGKVALQISADIRQTSPSNYKELHPYSFSINQLYIVATIEKKGKRTRMEGMATHSLHLVLSRLLLFRIASRFSNGRAACYSSFAPGEVICSGARILSSSASDRLVMRFATTLIDSPV